MSYNSFHFMPPKTLSTREHWLDRSNALSHSAKVAHKRKKQNTSAPHFHPTGQPLTGQFRLQASRATDPPTTEHAQDSSDDQNAVSRTVQNHNKKLWSILSQVPMTVSRSALDPFFQPAASLDVPDEKLLHIYLSTIPDQIYGTTSGDESSFVHRESVRVIATNTIGLLWLLLVVESTVTSFQPNQRDTYRSLLARKSRVLRLMARRLQDKQSLCSDDFILATAIATGCERRLGNIKEARQHLIATKRLLELRGGLHTVRYMTYPLSLMVVNIFVEQSMVNFFESLDVLTTKVSWLKNTLRAWQSHNIDLRISAASSGEGVENTYWTKRSAAFCAGSPLREFVRSILEAGLNGHERSSLGFLFTMNHAFWACRGNDRVTTTYIEKLVDAVERSASQNFILQAGDLRLPSMLLLLMIFQDSVQAYEWPFDIQDLLIFEQVFEFVNLLELASDQSRILVTDALHSWLITDIYDTKHTCMLHESVLENLETEILASWCREQQNYTSPGPSDPGNT